MILKIKRKTSPSPLTGEGAQRADEGEFVMLVFPADQKFNSKKVLESLNIKNIRFATEEEVGELTSGVQIGGVPPFGNLFNLPVYADPSLFDNEIFRLQCCG